MVGSKSYTITCSIVVHSQNAFTLEFENIFASYDARFSDEVNM